MEEKEALSQLRYAEQELADVVEQSAGRVSDQDVRDGLHRISEQHSHQAGELDDALIAIGAEDEQPPAEFREHLAAVEREVRHARDLDGLFTGLADAERLDVELHELFLAEGFPPEVADTIGKQLDEDREHLDFLENRAAGMDPAIRGVREVPKEGPVF